jgi:hypothetical protein
MHSAHGQYLSTNHKPLDVSAQPREAALKVTLIITVSYPSETPTSTSPRSRVMQQLYTPNRTQSSVPGMLSAPS